jgi:hypothetical protein
MKTLATVTQADSFSVGAGGAAEENLGQSRFHFLRC